MNYLARASLFTLSFLLIFIHHTFASHISGGDIRYQLLSTDGTANRYEITMSFFRTCNYNSMDGFDIQAPISIFQADGTGNYLFINSLEIPLIEPVSRINQDTTICQFLPPDICLEVGHYRFELDLPIINQDYIIVYQRCCRSNGTSNISDSDRTGVTISTTITPDAQQLGNSNPVFNMDPAIVSCANEKFELDFSAVDPDGDQLIYKLSPPLIGAGILGAFEPGDPTACDGFRPNPSCPPPFENLSFINPYSALAPLPISDTLTLDENTGLMTGTPNILGVYAAAVLVQEYRNGNLMGEYLREFQFNIINCDDCDTPTSNKSISTVNVQIFPNPSLGIISVELSDLLANTQIKIYDLQGQLVHQERLYQHINTIDLSQLPASLYFYAIENKKAVFKQGKLLLR